MFLKVTDYLWIEKSGEIVREMPTGEYWPDFTGHFEDGTAIKNGKFWEDGIHYCWIPWPELPEPTHERLENGVVLKVRKWNSHIRFYRTRRLP